MGITAKCSNGHILKVKDEFAGKSGLCPHCRGRVFVPMPIRAQEKARISDDEIMGLLGHDVESVRGPTLAAAPSDSVLDDHGNGGHGNGTSHGDTVVNVLGSSATRKTKICPNCLNIASVAFTHCPRCGTTLPVNGTVAK